MAGGEAEEAWAARAGMMTFPMAVRAAAGGADLAAFEAREKNACLMTMPCHGKRPPSHAAGGGGERRLAR